MGAAVATSEAAQTPAPSHRPETQLAVRCLDTRHARNRAFQGRYLAIRPVANNASLSLLAKQVLFVIARQLRPCDLVLLLNQAQMHMGPFRSQRRDAPRLATSNHLASLARSAFCSCNTLQSRETGIAAFQETAADCLTAICSHLQADLGMRLDMRQCQQCAYDGTLQLERQTLTAKIRLISSQVHVHACVWGGGRGKGGERGGPSEPQEPRSQGRARSSEIL